MDRLSNKELMAASGIKNTKQRNLILDILKSSKLPLTAEQIFFGLHEIDLSISLSTVYRTIEMFVNKGIIMKALMTEDNKAMYVLNSTVHEHHLICIGCKEITVIDHCPMANFEKSIEEQTNFQITGHNLELYGYCTKCKH